MRHTFPYRVARIARLFPSRLLDALCSHRCAACDVEVADRRAFCVPCAATVERAPHDGDTPWAAGAHGGALATAIHRLKYRDRPDLARPLGGLIAGVLPASLDVDLVAPVPLHPRRLGLRGYNQAALLAGVVAFERALKHDPTALVRIRDTATQAELGRAERLDNVAGAFAATSRLAGRRILLVDDVTTTGATLRACSEAARRAGAVGVVTATVAITLA